VVLLLLLTKLDVVILHGCQHLGLKKVVDILQKEGREEYIHSCIAIAIYSAPALDFALAGFVVVGVPGPVFG
jgi:hypothetical protein